MQYTTSNNPQGRDSSERILLCEDPKLQRISLVAVVCAETKQETNQLPVEIQTERYTQTHKNSAINVKHKA